MSTPPQLQGRLVRVLDLTPADIAAWRELAEAAAESNPLVSPDCIVAAAHAYTDGPEMYVVIAEQAGAFYGITSLQRARQRRDRRPLSYLERLLPTATTQVRRTRHNLTPLLRRDFEQPAMVALLRTLQAAPPPLRFDLLRIETMNGDGAVARAVAGACVELNIARYELETWQRAVHFPHALSDPAALEKAAKSQRRRIKEVRNPLERHLGTPVQFVDRSDDALALEELFRLERTGYKFDEGVAVESFPGEPDWLRTFCAALRERNEVRLFTLEADSRVLALELYFANGRNLFFIHRTFDETEQEYSPGGLLNLLFFDYFRSQEEYDFLDSCTKPTNPFTYRQYNASALTLTQVLAIGGRRSRLALQLFGLVRDRLIRRSDETSSAKEQPS